MKNDWFQNNIDLYYINLDISKDRNEKMRQQLDNLGVKYHRFPAYNGKKININFSNNLTKNYNVYNPKGIIYLNKKGSFGNYLSQMSCWYDFYLNSKKKYIMVMEDDIELLPNFNINKLQNIIYSIQNEDWDMLKLYHFGQSAGKKKNQFVFKAKNDGSNTNNTGMQIYLIPKNKIPKIIKNILPINYSTFDDTIKQKMNDLNIYITNEKYIYTQHTNSDRKTIDKN